MSYDAMEEKGLVGKWNEDLGMEKIGGEGRKRRKKKAYEGGTTKRREIDTNVNHGQRFHCVSCFLFIYLLKFHVLRKEAFSCIKIISKLNKKGRFHLFVLMRKLSFF